MVMEGGLTYTSKIVTPQRDYLFCNDRLSSIVDGEKVDGARFNYWMSALLATQQEYGDPTTVEYVTVRRPRPWEVGHSLLRSMLSVTPRHEFIQLFDLVVGDAAKKV